MSINKTMRDNTSTAQLSMEFGSHGGFLANKDSSLFWGCYSNVSEVRYFITEKVYLTMNFGG